MGLVVDRRAGGCGPRPTSRRWSRAMKDKPKTLSAPLRVYWSLVPEGWEGLAGECAVNAAGELKRLKVFFVTLRLSLGRRPDLPDIVASLKPSVVVTVSVADEASFPDETDLSAADGLDLMPKDGAALAGLLRLSSALGERRAPVSVSLVPAKDNAGFIDEALSMALEAGVRAFNLPNPDLTGNGTADRAFALDGGARRELKKIIEGRLGPLGDKVRLSVHDLFLHRELGLPGLGARIEYAGCQAGDAIGFIDREGLVYPCSTWPEPLGRLGACGFAEIWASEARHALRETAHTLPEDCAGCGEAPDCKGGCIGMAYALGEPGGRDPGCER